MPVMPTPRPEVLVGDIDALAQEYGLSHEVMPDGVHRHYGNTHDLLVSACKGLKRRGYASERVWSGADFETAVHLALTGWHEAVPVCESLFARLSTRRTESILPVFTLSSEPEGDVDLERYMEGDDECFWVPEQTGVRVDAQDMFVRFDLDPFASCGIEVDTLLKRGTYLAALVYLFERSGYATAVRLRMPTEGSHKEWLLEVDFKDYGQTLDLPRLLFWIGHPAVMRQLCILAYRGPGSMSRGDAIYSRQDAHTDEPGVITAPGIVGYGGYNLEPWINEVLTKHGLVIEG